MSCRLITSEEEFGKLGAAWDALVDDSVYPNFFHRHDWLSLWWKWFGRRLGTLRILVTEEDRDPARGRLLSALPLWQSGSRLRPLGYDGTTCPEYPGLIVRKTAGPDGQSCAMGEAVAAMLHYFERNRDWSEIHFEDRALDDPGTAALLAGLAGRFPHWTARGDERYFIPLPGTYDDYLATRSAHNRQKKRTRLRRAINRFHAEAVPVGAETIESWFSFLPELSASALARKGAATPWLREDFAGFHKELMVRLLPKNEARVFFLRCEGAPVAFRYGFAYKNKFYGYQTACDPSHPSRAGDVLTQMVLIELIREGFVEFDFLRGLEDYKTLWTDASRQTESVRIFRVRGTAYRARVLFESLLRPLGRRVKRVLFAKKSKQKTRLPADGVEEP